MKQKGSKTILVFAGLFVAGIIYFYFTNKPVTQNILPEETLPPTSDQASPATTENFPGNQQPPGVPDGWLTYQSEDYGFRISYPFQYQVLMDPENLSGWPNAVFLLSTGDQSYDIAVEVWDNQSQYQDKYPNQEIAFKAINNKYVTAADITNEEKNAEIISTFEAL